MRRSYGDYIPPVAAPRRRAARALNAPPMEHALGLAGGALYLCAAARLWLDLRAGRAHRAALWLWAAALACHAAAVAPALAPAPNLTLSNTHSLAMLLAAALLLAACRSRPLHALGLAALPLAAAALLFGVFDSHERAVAAIGAPGMRLHVLSSLLAYSVALLAAALAVALRLQNRRLKRRGARPSAALPPLDAMESFLTVLLALAFALLTAALASGWAYYEDLFAQHLAHKVAFSSLAWLVLGVLLAGRAAAGWRGRALANLTLAGVALLALAYFGSKFVLELVLERV